MREEEQLYTSDEAARITSLSPLTLRKMAYERRIRSYKVLGALRFKKEDLESLIVERPAKQSA